MRRNPEIEIVKTGLPKKLMIKRIEVLKKSRESLIGGRVEIEIVKTGLPKKLVKRIKVVCENKEMSSLFTKKGERNNDCKPSHECFR